MYFLTSRDQAIDDFLFACIRQQSILCMLRYLSARPCSRVTGQSEPNRIRSRGNMEKYLQTDTNTVHQGFDSSPCARVTMQAEPNYVKGQGR